MAEWTYDNPVDDDGGRVPLFDPPLEFGPTASTPPAAEEADVPVVLTEDERAMIRDSLGWDWLPSRTEGIPTPDEALADTYAAMGRIVAARLATANAVLSVVESLTTAAEYRERASLSRTFTGEPFPATVHAEDLRAALDGTRNNDLNGAL